MPGFFIPVTLTGIVTLYIPGKPKTSTNMLRTAFNFLLLCCLACIVSACWFSEFTGMHLTVAIPATLIPAAVQNVTPADTLSTVYIAQP